MKNHSRRVSEIAWGIAAIVLVLVLPGLSSAAEISITYGNDRMTVDVANATLESVLQELSAEYGMIVLVDEAIKSKPVTVRFTDLPTEKAIKRLIHPYSSATIFSKRLNSRGQDELYISELKVFESDTGEPSEYVQIATPRSHTPRPASGEEGRPKDSYSSPLRVPPTVPGNYGNTTYAAKAQQGVGSHLVRSQIKKISYLRTKGNMEEIKLKKEISQLKMSISNAGSEADRRTVLSQLSDKTRELNRLQARNRNRIHSEERLLRQLQMQ